ncbi:unnamed protein product [Pieris macdunnoughi]|uniref:Uncharacterized protein n=1 Tax=Pieris macdunnoughi TaxID=345717 RepID=A0A821XBX3_9NEOP|nr:unnamed protein product [Pieris macdunnoughi]
MKAKAFYNCHRRTFHCHSIAKKTARCLNCPTKAAYFSRQFNISNFTVVIGTSKSALDNVRTYYWCENEHAKSSSEIASAVFDTLISLDIPSDKTRVRLCADGCGGDNKNTILVGMCMKWLYSNAPPHHFGEDWRTIESLAYYRNIEVNNDNSEEREDLVCVPLEDSDICV